MRIHPFTHSFSKTDRVKNQVTFGISKKIAVRNVKRKWPVLKQIKKENYKTGDLASQPTLFQ